MAPLLVLLLHLFNLQLHFLFHNNLLLLLFNNFLFNNNHFNDFFLHLGWLNLDLFHLNLNLNWLLNFGDLNFFDFLNVNYFLFWFYLRNINVVDFSFHINLHILFAFKDSLHDLDVLIAQNGNLIIFLVEEGQLKGAGFDIELLLGKGHDIVVVQLSSIQLNEVVEFEN